MQDQRSKDAVRAAINFGNNLIGEDELNAAAADAADAAADADADAAADAADAAADADAAAAAADAAAAAAYAADAAAKNKNQATTADVCREVLGQILIQEVNKKLSHK